MARIFLALILAPGLGALSGGLVARSMSGWLSAAPQAGGDWMSAAELRTFALLLGGSLGLALAGVLIWCAFQPRRDPRKRAADVVLIFYALAGLVALRSSSPWAAALTVTVWIAGAAIVLWALGRPWSEVADRERRRGRTEP